MDTSKKFLLNNMIMWNRNFFQLIFLFIFLSLIDSSIQYSNQDIELCEEFNYTNEIIKGFRPISFKLNLVEKLISINNSIDCAKSCCLTFNKCDVAYYQNNTCSHIICNSDDLCKFVKIYPNEPESYIVKFRTSSFKNHPLINQTELNVLVNKNIVIHLPNDSITINASVDASNEQYLYKWQLIESPMTEETGIIKNQNSPSLSLFKLKEGLYRLNVTVTGKNAKGQAYVNITVLPPYRTNKPPVAIIQPNNSTVQLPIKEKFLDGSTSTDDDNIISYKWEKIQAPIDYKDPSDLNAATLKLDNLVAGMYIFKLTVTDSDNATSSNTAILNVLKEKDYPPTAVAGEDQIIYLPQNSVILNGSASSDDKKIVSWQWTLSEDGGIKNKPMNMDGVTTPYLNLSNLDVGTYKFILKVTDSSEQSSTSETHVFVKPQANTKPEANAGKNQRIELPLKKNLTLDGSGSKDYSRNELITWHWSQINGPKLSNILDPNNSITNVTGLIPGLYTFNLQVTNQNNLTDNSTVNITVVQIENVAPVANGGGNQEIFGLDKLVILNGSKSYDDIEILNYLWTREETSLAAGTILDQSDKKPILIINNLIEGKYIFKLTVTDNQGAKGSDIVTLIVRNESIIKNYVRIILNISSKKFLYKQHEMLIKRVEILLSNNNGDNLKINNIKYNSILNTNLVSLDFTIDLLEKNISLPAEEVVRRLRSKLRTDKSLINPEILSVNTVICQNSCSKHGICQEETKQCLCDTFWMQDFIRFRFGDLKENCDWSILYFILFSSMIILLFSSILWSLICLLIRKRPGKFRHRIRRNDFSKKLIRKSRLNYTLLKNSNFKRNQEMSSDSENETIQHKVLTKFKRKNTILNKAQSKIKLTNSNSKSNYKDSSSDSEVMFESTSNNTFKNFN